MQKIIVLNGSPKGRRGNTSILVDEFLKGIKSVDDKIQIQEEYLSEATLNGCVGCFNCWTKTPGKCIFKDDMTRLLKSYLEADTVIWATPLYHHGMTTLLKRFVERTLPINEPYIVKEDGRFAHPERFSVKDKNNIVISNCGFPEYKNFDILKQTFGRITHNRMTEVIMCTMGELLSKKPLRGRIGWYLNGIQQAGEEFAQNQSFTQETRDLLENPLVPIEDFIEMANLSWEADGEIPPELNSALDNNETKSVSKSIKGLSYLKLMKQSFISNQAKGVDAILEFSFTDLDETHYLKIKDQSCSVIEGKSDGFTTKIITSYTTWIKIANGELNGSKALMDGDYKIEGDLNFMMTINKIFGSGSEDNEKSVVAPTKEKVLGIKLEKWMSFSFSAWIMSWICISNSLLWGIVIPFTITAGIVIVKKVNKEVTYFEKMSLIYFSILILMNQFKLPLVGSSMVVINYFVMAVIWISSLMDNKPLTSDYSKHRFEGSIENNAMFMKTNQILTLLWSGIFLFQGLMYVLLEELELLKLSPGLYVITIFALVFTSWFSGWYPKYIASGRGRKG